MIIGLEIHAQIASRTKMFCRCDNDSFGVEANVNVCPVCMGFPGQLPVVNEEAVKKAIVAALALNCDVKQFSKFDRKNYFYPDSPKGFQISQYDEPLSENGFVEFYVDEGKVLKIRVARLHIEDDAGKLMHVSGGSLVDFNRAGSPLMEIVSEPDLRSALEASEYAKAIQKILRFVGSSEADMEKGMLRFDASVSLRPVGEDKLYPRAEIKNLNSFKSLEEAINFEIERQTELWDQGTPQLSAVTVGWDDEARKTFFMRDKEDSTDYRYFPEPDIPPLTFDGDFIDALRRVVPELPDSRYRRYSEEFGITSDEAKLLSSELDISNYFESLIKSSSNIKLAVSFVTSILMRYLNRDLIKIGAQKVTPLMMAELINLVDKGVISNNQAKGEVFEAMYDSGESPALIVEERGLTQVSDLDAIRGACLLVISDFPVQVEEFKSGKDKVIGFLIGQVMKSMSGKSNPQVVDSVMRELLMK